ncbi:hypothetical protein T4D_1228 [Trichinella pseudospiralis]|uniref:Uncharacterized protein n=1 Tax=Trichinella pseudospiralis TaxID=6337 RepID=A0A0V1FKP9_TRIPS|nr:hypothetical protein T4D_1228 [Trichinella pseudospiralis]
MLSKESHHTIDNVNLSCSLHPLGELFFVCTNKWKLRFQVRRQLKLKDAEQEQTQTTEDRKINHAISPSHCIT